MGPMLSSLPAAKPMRGVAEVRTAAQEAFWEKADIRKGTAADFQFQFAGLPATYKKIPA